MLNGENDKSVRILLKKRLRTDWRSGVRRTHDYRRRKSQGLHFLLLSD
jgi:hypothetical protein